MPIQQPKQFNNDLDFGKPDTMRAIVPLQMFYLEFYDSYGRRKKELVIERKTDHETHYLTLEGGVQALKRLNPALHKMVAGVLGQKESKESKEPQVPLAEEVGELKVSAVP